MREVIGPLTVREWLDAQEYVTARAEARERARIATTIRSIVSAVLTPTNSVVKNRTAGLLANLATAIDANSVSDQVAALNKFALIMVEMDEQQQTAAQQQHADGNTP